MQTYLLTHSHIPNLEMLLHLKIRIIIKTRKRFVSSLTCDWSDITIPLLPLVKTEKKKFFKAQGPVQFRLEKQFHLK